MQTTSLGMDPKCTILTEPSCGNGKTMPRLRQHVDCSVNLSPSKRASAAMTVVDLMRQISLPRPKELIGGAKAWLRENGAWWMGSVLGDLVVLTVLLLVLGPMTAASKSDAPLFNVD